MSDSENPCGRIEKGTRCGPSGAILAFKTAPEEVCHHSKTRHATILRSYGELGLELPTQVESKIERKSEQNSAHDRLLISAHQLLANTEAGHAPEGQSSKNSATKGQGPPILKQTIVQSVFTKMIDHFSESKYFSM